MGGAADRVYEVTENVQRVSRALAVSSGGFVTAFAGELLIPDPDAARITNLQKGFGCLHESLVELEGEIETNGEMIKELQFAWIKAMSDDLRSAHNFHIECAKLNSCVADVEFLATMYEEQGEDFSVSRFEHNCGAHIGDKVLSNCNAEQFQERFSGTNAAFQSSVRPSTHEMIEESISILQQAGRHVVARALLSSYVDVLTMFRIAWNSAQEWAVTICPPFDPCSDSELELMKSGWVGFKRIADQLMDSALGISSALNKKKFFYHETSDLGRDRTSSTAWCNAEQKRIRHKKWYWRFTSSDLDKGMSEGILDCSLEDRCINTPCYVGHVDPAASLGCRRPERCVVHYFCRETEYECEGGECFSGYVDCNWDKTFTYREKYPDLGLSLVLLTNATRELIYLEAHVPPYRFEGDWKLVPAAISVEAGNWHMECMAPSTKVRTPHGSAVALQDLNRGDEILSFTGDSFSASQQVIGGHVHNSSMIGWASKSLRTAKFLKFWTEGGRSVTVTPDHYLWVSPGSVLTAAKSVTEDMTLAFVSDTDGAVSWDKITCIHEEEEEGEFVPLIANIQAHEGDFVITDCGIVVPSYANLQVFRGYHAREAHELFQNILRSLGHLESSHPCLFEETRHGLLVAQILHLILEIADPDDHGAGSVLDLAWVVQNIKLAAPLSKPLQYLLAHCPGFAEEVEASELPFFQIARDILNAV